MKKYKTDRPKKHRNNISRKKKVTTPESLQNKPPKNSLAAFQRRTGYPESQKLPENPYSKMDEKVAYEKYNKILPEYGNWKAENIKIGDFKNPNIGWKMHLNVTPENVVEVSTYLRKEGYCHKYLSG